MMSIEIKPSPTADSRTCDAASVDRQKLLESSRQHIGDVAKAMAFFASRIAVAAAEHDYDKLTEIEWFHRCFQDGFKDVSWLENHYRIHRHHLNRDGGVPVDVNLLDVLEYIADCVVAGLARAGTVYPLEISDSLLRDAFENTVLLLNRAIKVKE